MLNLKMFEIKKVYERKEAYLNTAIVIPVFNEQDNIAEVIDESIQVKPQEIIVVDDASTDNTGNILENYKDLARIITNEKNLGKQGSVKKGLKHAAEINGIEAVVTVDGDMQHPPEYIPDIVSFLDDYDLVIAVRSKKEMPFHRKLANEMVKMVYKSAGVPLSDVQTGYRAYDIDSARFIADNLEEKGGYNMEHEILDILAEFAIHRSKKIRIAEYKVPCPYGNTESHIKMKDNLVLLMGTFNTANKLRKRKKKFILRS